MARTGTQPIYIKLNDDERRALQLAAAWKGLSLGEYVTDLVRANLRSKKVPDFVREFANEPQVI